MLRMNSISLSATSRISDVDVMYFNASFPNDIGNYSISKTISNHDEYVANKSQCDADYLKFEEKASQIAAGINDLYTSDEGIEDGTH